MALNAGSVSGGGGGSGLAKELYDIYVATIDISGDNASVVAQSQQQVADLCNAFAQAVVAHVTANAVVTVAAGIPVSTAGSAAAQTGSTTSPGTGTIA